MASRSQPTGARDTVLQPLLLAAALPLALCGWLLLVLRPAHEAAPLVVAAVPALLLALALLARAGQRGGVALALLAGAVVLATDASLRGSFDGEHDLQSLAKLALWCAGLVLAAWRWRELAAAARRPATGLILLFALWCLLSSLWSATPVYTAAAAVGLLGVWITATLCARTLGAPLALGAVAGALAVAVGASIGLGVVAPERALTPMENGAILRLSGVFGSPNNLGRAAALLVLLAMLLAVQLWPQGRRRAALAVWLVGGGLGVAGLVMSESRAALAALGVGLGVAGVVLLGRRRVALLLGALGLLLVAGLGLLALLSSPLLREAAVELVSRTGRLEELTSFTGRTEIWSAVLSLIGEAPWLGHGYASGRAVLPETFQGAYGWTTTSAHNLWLQAWMTTGAIGLLAVLAAQAAWLRQAIARPQAARDGVMAFVLAVGLFEAGALGPSVTVLTFAWCWAVALGREEDR